MFDFLIQGRSKMFHFTGKLEHLLQPTDYYDPAVFDAERRSVFAKTWSPLCLVDEVSKNGDRYAGQIAGQQVVVINHQGVLSAFSNVCGHRHSLICPPGHGSSKKMKCQIHGWEYDSAGHLTTIPDGKHFKVVKPGDFSLRRFRVEQCGPFVFVNLSNDGPSLEEFLGTLAPEFNQWYQDVRLIQRWDHEHDVNWKVPVENAIESYHVPMVHPTTFQDFREEALHDHRLEPTYTRYGDLLPYEDKPGFVSLAFRIYTRLLIRNPSFERFTHTHLFPNIMLYYGDIYRSLTIIEPLTPRRFRFRCYGFVPTQVRFGWLGRKIQDLSMVVLTRMGRKIINEDAALWPSVQQGLESSDHRGVLSAREERVFAFQRYLRCMLGASATRVDLNSASSTTSLDTADEKGRAEMECQ